jgi:hypothetical protein
LRADITPLIDIHLSPWRAESETVIGLSRVAVVVVLRGVGQVVF